MVLLSELVDGHVEGHHENDFEHTDLYNVMRAEHDAMIMHKSGTLYRSKLWSTVAPAGNIYRYVGLLADYRLHCYDLQCQLRQLADKHKDLLGGQQASETDRMEKLIELLRSTPVKQKSDAEHGVVSYGYFPLEVYLTSQVASYGPWVVPEDSQEWLSHTVMALMVCTVQVVCPVLILLDEWIQPSNKLATWTAFLRTLNFSELMCFGTTLEEKLHTAMGVLLLLLVFLIIRSYVHDQRCDGNKSGRLATNRFWMALGQVTNMWSAFVITLAIPLRFWDEDNSTGIAMDSLTLLFIFMLDDFSGIACVYMGKSSESFQRDAAWNKALLSHCPVRLDDLINEGAKQADDLWQINLSSDGTLLLKRPGEEPRKCVRRIERIQSETTGLLNVNEGENRKLQYYVSPDRGRVIPGIEHDILDSLWWLGDHLLRLWGLVVPFMWMAVDEPCSTSSR